jgi:DNA-binding transcriptional MerR regulator
MPFITDLSDEPKYTIKTLCAQTGVLAVTVRAWERRYGLLSPQRAENRYRLYSERDIATLMWVKERADHGISISSAVREFQSLVTSGKPVETKISMASAAPQRKTNTPPAEYAKRLYQALIAHDDASANQIWIEFSDSFTLSDIWESILVPVLVEIGEAWYTHKIRITTEHIASAFIRGKLHALFHHLPNHRSRHFILIGCAPDEQHEISSLMLAILMRDRGHHVEYLGPDIPLDDLVDYARHERPRMIILTAMSEESALEMTRMPALLASLKPVPLFIFGGRAFIQQPKLIEKIKGIYAGDRLNDAVSIAENYLKES